MEKILGGTISGANFSTTKFSTYHILLPKAQSQNNFSFSITESKAYVMLFVKFSLSALSCTQPVQFFSR